MENLLRRPGVRSLEKYQKNFPGRDPTCTGALGVVGRSRMAEHAIIICYAVRDTAFQDCLPRMATKVETFVIFDFESHV